MAISVHRPKLLRNLPYFVRRINSSTPPLPHAPSVTSTTPQENLAEKPEPLAQQANNPEKITINLDDLKKVISPAGKPDLLTQQRSNPEKPSHSEELVKFAGGPGPFGPGPNSPENPRINLDDPKELFSSFSTPKLIKSTVTLHMASMDRTVDLGSWVMKSKLMNNPLSRKMVFDSVKYTFYDHFCGGKDLREVDRTVKKLSNSGLNAMLDYGLEHAVDNGSCDRNMEEFIQTIESTKSSSASSISFVVVKITAICPSSLLRRVSDLLRWEHKDKSVSLPWKLETLPIFSDSSAFYHTPERPNPLTPTEEHDLELAYQRLTKICLKSLETNVPLLIDAEDTMIQPAIDYFTYSAAIKYRREDTPLIFNTIQAYLKDARDRLVIAKKAANGMGVKMGFKLVRGAYMNSERAIAASLGVESPIHDTIQDTHTCYNDCAAFMLEDISRGSGSIVLATHNLESGKLAAAKAIGLGIKKDNQNLHFAQLYGMAEALSFGLRNAGFKVSKYLPFGPVEQVMPYLMRRAEENRGLLSSSSFDKQLMRKELRRRLIC